MQGDIFRLCNLVILDAKFAGKVELLRMVEQCTNSDVPHIVVNCGNKEFQLSYLYEKAAAVYHDLPDFCTVLSHVAKLSNENFLEEYNSAVTE